MVIDKLDQRTVTYKDGSLYVMAVDKMLRFDGIDKNPNVAPVDLTANFNLPPEKHHNWKYIAFGPDGKLYIYSGVGNIGTLSVYDTARVAAEMLDMPWEKCEVIWGDTSQNLPWSSRQGGSQTIHATSRANHAAALDAPQSVYLAQCWSHPSTT